MNGEQVGFGAFIMKAPKGHPSLLQTHKALAHFFNPETSSTMEWESSMVGIFVMMRSLISNWKDFLIRDEEFLDLGTLKDSPYNSPYAIQESVKMIHWSNATHKDTKDSPIEGSTYWELLKLTNLI